MGIFPTHVASQTNDLALESNNTDTTVQTDDTTTSVEQTQTEAPTASEEPVQAVKPDSEGEDTGVTNTQGDGEPTAEEVNTNPDQTLEVNAEEGNGEVTATADDNAAPAQTEDSAVAPTAEAEAVTQDTTDLVATDFATENLDAIVSTILPRSHNKFQMTLATLEHAASIGRRTTDLQRGLEQFQLVEACSAVVREHNLSAPLVAALRAIPSFEQSVKNFPQSTLYNHIHEHPTSARNVAGLESLAEAEVEATSAITTKTSDVVESFNTLLAGLGNTVANLKTQITESTNALTASDVSEDVLVTLPVHTLTGASFMAVLTKLEAHLKDVDTFNADDLRAYPEKVKTEVQVLSAIVNDIGTMIGIQFGSYGLSDADKSLDYQPAPGNFGDKNITKTDLILFLAKAGEVLDVLYAFAASKESIVSALTTSVAEMPAVPNSDDVTYGYLEHVTLLSSYTTLVTKLISEAVTVVSSLLTAVDAVLDVPVEIVSETVAG